MKIAMEVKCKGNFILLCSPYAVSYTHLDVYKRQGWTGRTPQYPQPTPFKPGDIYPF